jgi:YfiH family protein
MVSLYRFAKLDALASCLHGVSRKLEKGNCNFSQALHTGEPAVKVVENRKMLQQHFGKEGAIHFVVAEQTHSDHIFHITTPQTRGWQSMEDAIPDTDALICNISGVMIGVLTADCVPVLLFDPAENVAAAVHAGWKGTHKLIVSKTLKEMQAYYGCKPENIIAGIAPAIGGCCYEVGKEVAGYFMAYGEGVVVPKGEKYMLDLPQINKMQLLEAGLREEHIEMSGICTACDVEHFFSYRKEQGCSGRFISLIGVKN